MAKSSLRSASSGKEARKSVVFLHPDLGIGGAERLVVDAAVGLQQRGWKVVIFTSHCDPGHCFTEARDGTLDVRVRGNTIIPPNIAGRFAIFCAIARQVHLILSIAIFSQELLDLNPSHFFIDQLSAGVPLLRLLLPGPRILFYCHFPDKLLALRGHGLMRLVKSAYRLPFNSLESWSTGCSDDIVVNSRFTGGVVKSAFPGLRSRDLKVIYPCVDTATRTEPATKSSGLWSDLSTVFLSINRFEKKKAVDLALRAYSGLSAAQKKGSMLVIAGGYDPRMAENVSYLKELQALADSLGLKYQTAHKTSDLSPLGSSASVLFLPSVSDAVKQALLSRANLLIYTPRHEHFGIVPLEAMLNQVPVLAADEGGPVETVVDNSTGWLRNVAKADDWTEVMRGVVELQSKNPARLKAMGEAGKDRVQNTFSKWQMAINLDDILEHIRSINRPPLLGIQAVVVLVAGLLAAIVALYFGITFVR